MKRELIYPFLLKCCEFTKETFWRNIFEDLAYGYTPIGTFFYKNYLTCTQKGIEFSYKVENKNANVLYDEIYDLLHNKVGILSIMELESQKLILDNQCKQIDENTWASIRKKNFKDMLIDQYVLRMMEEYNLSLDQGKLMLSTIFLAMIFKTITNKNIKYENGRITEIEGIEFSQGNVEFTRKFIAVTPEETTEKQYEFKKFITDDWLNYLEKLCKLII